jgi:hypothetical protein
VIGGLCRRTGRPGLAQGDIVLAVDGRRCRAAGFESVWAHLAGDGGLEVFRDEEVRTFQVASGNAEEFFA